MKNQIEDSM